MQKPLAVVTGASRGIGRKTVEALAEASYRVAALARGADTLNELAGFKEEIYAFPCDVSDSKAVSQVFDRIHSELGEVSLLVNNAGFLQLAPTPSTSDEIWFQTLNANLSSAFFCTREVFSRWSQNQHPGMVINIGSLAGVSHTQKFPGTAAYAAAKSGVVGLTESLAEEAKAFGGRVVCVAPGAVNTQMLKEAAPELRAGAEPEDVARMLVELASSSGTLAFSGAVIPFYSNAVPN